MPWVVGLALLATIISGAVCAVIRPSSARCPPSWHVSTVLPTGAFGCARDPARGLCDSKGGCDDNTPDPEVRGMIFCTGGAVPIQRGDGLTVGCMRVSR